MLNCENSVLLLKTALPINSNKQFIAKQKQIIYQNSYISFVSCRVQRWVPISEKPTAAFVLSLLGGIFIMIAGLIVAVATAIIGVLAWALIPGVGGAIGGLVMALGALGLVFGILIIIGAVQINTGEPGRVRTWSVVVIVLSVLSLFVCGGGFVVGFILALIGGILGLTWSPPSK